MTVRAACVEDAPAIADAHVRSWQVAYAHLLPAEFLATMSVPERTQRWHDILSASESSTAVAEADGRVAAFVSFGKCRDADAPGGRGEIWALYAAPEAWGCGAGRALLAHAVEALRTLGFGETALWVLSGNARGRRFYEAAGFVPVAGSAQWFDIGGTPVEELKYLRTSAAGRAAQQPRGDCS
jgi:GNAT superfamily N-acetyltransferase